MSTAMKPEEAIAGINDMKIIITGSSGFVGQALIEGLERRGDTVIPLIRKAGGDARKTGHPLWNPIRGHLEPSIFEGVDAVINLNGANIAGRRWSAEYKNELRSSRLKATRLVAETLAGMSTPPRVLVSASATGFYGDRGDQPLDENSAPGKGFLADLSREWEEANSPAIEAGVRVVIVRLGMVVGSGGALDRMLLPFRMGLGGPIGNGRQWWPWIAIDDVVGAVAFGLDRETVSGPLNLVSPDEATSRDFARALGRVLHRPAVLPAPAFAVRLVAGEMADALLLSSARVRPEVLRRSGYQFVSPSLDEAISRAVEGS